jgi:hypothetical protein
MNDFDIAARKAEAELPDDLAEMTSVEVAEWFADNYRTAGHKRLGRILVARAKLAKAA